MNHPEPSRVYQRDGTTYWRCNIRPAQAKEEERNQEHIKTDHLLTDLKRRIISGGVVTMSAKAGKFALEPCLHYDLGTIADAARFWACGHGDDRHRLLDCV